MWFRIRIPYFFFLMKNNFIEDKPGDGFVMELKFIRQQAGKNPWLIGRYEKATFGARGYNGTVPGLFYSDKKQTTKQARET